MKTDLITAGILYCGPFVIAVLGLAAALAPLWVLYTMLGIWVGAVFSAIPR